MSEDEETTGQFFGDHTETYFARGGRVWLLQTPDAGPLPRPVDRVPPGLAELDPATCYDLDVTGCR